MVAASLRTLGDVVVAGTRQQGNTKEQSSQTSCSDMDDDGVDSAKASKEFGKQLVASWMRHALENAKGRTSIQYQEVQHRQKQELTMPVR